jgi:hypothetical protein
MYGSKALRTNLHTGPGYPTCVALSGAYTFRYGDCLQPRVPRTKLFMISHKPLLPLLHRLVGAAIAASALCLQPAFAANAFTAAPARQADFGKQRASRDVQRLAAWVLASRDSRGLPFVIVDKRQARLFVFDSGGLLRGNAPILLGLARGDDSVPGIGERKMADIKPFERTTPAGRFIGAPGRNANGEDIVWVDYDAAVSMHRVRATNPKERRLQRLATRSPADNRISYGCINVPAAFYDAFVSPLFAAHRAVVYVLPETRPLRELLAPVVIARPAVVTRPGPHAVMGPGLVP